MLLPKFTLGDWLHFKDILCIDMLRDECIIVACEARSCLFHLMILFAFYELYCDVERLPVCIKI